MTNEKVFNLEIYNKDVWSSYCYYKKEFYKVKEVTYLITL